MSWVDREMSRLHAMSDDEIAAEIEALRRSALPRWLCWLVLVVAPAGFVVSLIEWLAR